jgi:hypothetical protein
MFGPCGAACNKSPTALEAFGRPDCPDAIALPSVTAGHPSLSDTARGSRLGHAYSEAGFVLQERVSPNVTLRDVPKFVAIIRHHDPAFATLTRVINRHDTIGSAFGKSMFKGMWMWSPFHLLDADKKAPFEVDHVGLSSGIGLRTLFARRSGMKREAADSAVGRALIANGTASSLSPHLAGALASPYLSGQTGRRTLSVCLREVSLP